MNKPYIICHMVTSLDGKVTGDFLYKPECEGATDIYYEMNREYKKEGSGGFICGRVTMEQSFTGGYYPNLGAYEPEKKVLGSYMNFWMDGVADADYFAIAFDPKGRLGWQSNVIDDSDPGYGGAMIIEVLTQQVDPRYLTYLQEKEISYFFAGEREIDVELALDIICTHLAPEFFVLEGGSIVNGFFLRADCIDEISLVQAPVVAGKDGKPLFMDAEIKNFELIDVQSKNGNLVSVYKKSAV